MDENNVIIEKLKSLRENKIFDGKKVVLFGANKSSKQMYDYLVQYNVEFSAIVDNDSRKWGRGPFGNLTVYSPEKYLSTYDEKYIILIVSQYYAEMTEQLEHMGYQLNKEIYVVQKLFSYKYDDSERTFLFLEEKIRAGVKIYERIAEYKRQQLLNEKTLLLICPYVGNGDMYIIGQMLDLYLTSRKIKDYVITVVGNACAKIGKMFSWANIIVLSQDDSDALVSYVRFVGLKETHSKILNDCYQQVVNRRLRGYRGINFWKMFQTVVFDYPVTEKIECKEILQNEEEIEKYVKQVGMKKNHSVIIAPYANTLTRISEKQWQQVALYYLERGYRVYTNSSGENEPVVSGTQRICAPFSYMQQLVEYAGNFIGIRSGLCDIIANAKANKIILYPKGKLFGSCSYYDYFSLNQMGLCDDAKEFEVDEDVNLVEIISEKSI